jgi:hypothetical protein
MFLASSVSAPGRGCADNLDRDAIVGCSLMRTAQFFRADARWRLLVGMVLALYVVN